MQPELLPCLLPPDTIWFQYTDFYVATGRISICVCVCLNNLARTISLEVEWQDSGKLHFLGVLKLNIIGLLFPFIFSRITRYM